jgi:hypothetical protein
VLVQLTLVVAVEVEVLKILQPLNILVQVEQVVQVSWLRECLQVQE